MHLLKNMELFVLAAEKKSFAAAAKELKIPSSTASHQIAKFEKELGQQLFARTTRTVELTASGRLLYQHFSNMLEEGRLALKALENMSETPSGHLHVRMTSSFGIRILGPRIGKFHQLYPNINLHLELISRDGAELSGKCDLAILGGSLPDSSLYCRKIAQVERHLYASPNYLEQNGQVKDPGNLLSHNCILMTYLDLEKVWRLGKEDKCINVPIKGTLSTNSVSLMIEMISQGIGIGPIGDFLARNFVQKGLLTTVLPDWSFSPVPIYALTNSKILSARSRVFIDFLVSELTSLTSRN